jgi:hypothetical protein
VAEESQIEPLDLTTDPNDVIGSNHPYAEKPYDARPQEDSARRYIAYTLVGLLGFVVAWALLTVTFWCGKSDEVVKILQIVLTPIITLVSAATGFYYGSKSIGSKTHAES